MAKKLQIVLVLVFLAATSIACRGDTPEGISSKLPGKGNSTLSNVDPYNNGMYAAWFGDDTTYVFCTDSPVVKASLDEIIMKRDTRVYFEYADWSAADRQVVERSSFFYSLASSCGQGYSGTHSAKLLMVMWIGKE